jgi:tetratricopeptide (TPR) repeat protein
MSTPSTSRAGLDDMELLHLALNAMRNNRHDEAIALLKRTIQTSPDKAWAHYLLGAEHAQIGLYDRAVTEMAQAVRLDPGIPAAAHFQLGLLHLTAGRTREAEAAWEPLDRLAPDDALRLFKSALLHLVHEERDKCIEELQAGIALNKLNEALNDDMRRLLADLQARQKGMAGDSNSNVPPLQVPVPSKRMLLSTYDQNQRDSSTD